MRPVSITPAPAHAGMCPHCQHSLVTERDQQPWCERCEWRLDAFADDAGLGRLGNRLSRWERRVGFRLNRDLYAALSTAGLDRPRLSPTRATLLAVALLITAGLLAMVVGGIALILWGAFLLKAVGALLVIVGGTLRPRLGRLERALGEADELTRDRAPQLFALVDQVAAAVGAPRPHIMGISAEWDAAAGAYGLRRRRLLRLGLPMWTALRPQERVALLGHELGHYVNNDGRRGVLTHTALDFFGRLADLLDPRRIGQEMIDDGFNLVVRVVEWVVWPLLWTVSRLARLAHLALTLFAARDSQRAEYYADALAVRAGGTTATLSLLDLLAGGDVFTAVVGSRARARQGASGWREAVERARAAQAPRLPRLRQLTLRQQASPFVSHPPAGLRYRMISAQPHRDPLVVLTEAESARIDAELAAFEERHRRIIAERW